MAPSRLVTLPALVVLALLLATLGSPPATSLRDASATSTTAARARVVRVVAAGDIACPPGLAVTPTQCQQDATAALARRLDPSLVLTLGDHQYNESSLAQFNASYANSWGTLRPRTRPAIGNHEYLTPGASGYYTYFRNRQPGPPGYYRVAAGAWQVFVLNSNCDKVSCAREATWLDRQMKAHPSKCSMITMHHPRYSSGGEHGNDPAVIPLWRAAYKHHNDLVLSGHEHDYERFNRMDAVGHLRPYRGMLEFVVGTGGRNLYPLGKHKLGSAYYQDTRFGVLRLSLGPRRFSWAFRAIDGRVLDSGSRTCL
jgi:Calcineurin-like phosphoesterase